jgi:hypothetical protein
MFDFFDYLVGEKLEFPDQKSFSEEMTVTFKFNQSIPKPCLYKYRKSEKEAFKSIRLQ